MRWPSEQVISLPNLKKLILGDGLLYPRYFQEWMKQMPSLEYLELDSTLSASDRESDWRFVCDAIRQHPKALELKLE